MFDDLKAPGGLELLECMNYKECLRMMIREVFIFDMMNTRYMDRGIKIGKKVIKLWQDWVISSSGRIWGYQALAGLGYYWLFLVLFSLYNWNSISRIETLDIFYKIVFY